jgi:hypothetical protein
MKKTLSKTIGGLAFGAVAAILMCGTNAGACSLPAGMGLRPVNFADPALKLGVASAPSEAPQAKRESASSAGVVGLWQATYSSAGTVVDMAFEAFHSDGTEMLNDITPPAEGNVCLGVWVQESPRTFKLTHPSWTFDASGNLTGTATFQTTINLTSADTFSGTYTLTYYDTHGTQGSVYTGTMTATRILPQY